MLALLPVASIPLRAWLVHYRISLASTAGSRLSSPSLAADEDGLAGLALDLGFSHHSHLTSTFTRHFGVPPGQARRLLRQSGDLSPDYASAVEILRRP